jgi:predicted Fe-Mo cluster-binding NifX family protein
MKLAVAATGSAMDSDVAQHAARAPFFLLFDEKGALLEAVANPFAKVDRAAAPQAAAWLADSDVTLLVAGDFGPRFISALQQRGIDHVQLSGQVADALALLNR